ncbi:MAG: hypothetical protein KGI50_01920 [Patescibacteria group bacterium]|nr:hypothetical protein [Patescibacteria group bacterium]MDE2437898.1 hypothetical protein [Patescibacteria group bacterium]
MKSLEIDVGSRSYRWLRFVYGTLRGIPFDHPRDVCSYFWGIVWSPVAALVSPWALCFYFICCLGLLMSMQVHKVGLLFYAKIVGIVLGCMLSLMVLVLAFTALCGVLKPYWDSLKKRHCALITYTDKKNSL